MNRNELHIDCAPSNGSGRRLVVATHIAGGEHRDKLDTDSAFSRNRFVRETATRFKVASESLAWLDAVLTETADDADRRADSEAQGIRRAAEEEAKRIAEANVLPDVAELLVKMPVSCPG